MNKKNIILHVGAHKTGTTFLQKQVFPFLKNVYYTGLYSKNFDKDEFHEFVCFRDAYNTYKLFNPKFSNKKESSEFKKYVSSFTSNIKEDNFLFSREALFGSSWRGYYNHFENTCLLKEFFPEAKIFLVFRRQDTWIESLYTQYFHIVNSPVKLNYFIGYKNGEFNDKSNYLYMEDMKWLKYVKNYIDTFGHENVLALPHEMLKNEPEKFLSNFYEFSGLETYYPEIYKYENKRPRVSIKDYEPLGVLYKTLTDKIPSRKSRYNIDQKDGFFRKKLSLYKTTIDYEQNKLDEKQRQKIKSLFIENNTKLAKLINLDLAEYGYY